MLTKEEIDFGVYDKPPYFPAWLRKGENMRFFVALQNAQMKQLEEVVDAIADQWDLDVLKANTALEDRAGALLNVDRAGLANEDYAILIMIKTIINNNLCTVEDIYKVLETYFGATADYWLEANYPAGIRAHYKQELNETINMNDVLRQVVKAGIDYGTTAEVFPQQELIIIHERLRLTYYLLDVFYYSGWANHDGHYNYGKMLYDPDLSIDIGQPIDLVYIDNNHGLRHEYHFDGEYHAAAFPVSESAVVENPRHKYIKTNNRLEYRVTYDSVANYEGWHDHGAGSRENGGITDRLELEYNYNGRIVTHTLED